MNIKEKIESQSELGAKIKGWISNHPVSLVIIGLCSIPIYLGTATDSIDKVIGFNNKYFPAVAKTTPTATSNDSSKNPTNNSTPTPSNPTTTKSKPSAPSVEQKKTPASLHTNQDLGTSTPLISSQSTNAQPPGQTELKPAENPTSDVANGITIEAALALASGQTLANRRESIRSIIHRLPLHLSGNDVTRLLANETLNSRLQLLTLVVTRVDGSSLSATDIQKILANETLSTRLEMITYLVPFARPELTADEAAAILGPLTLSDRVRGIRSISSKIRKPLTASGIEKILEGLTLSNRNAAINDLL